MINTIIFDIGNVLVRYDCVDICVAWAFLMKCVKKSVKQYLKILCGRNLTVCLGRQKCGTKMSCTMAEYPDEMDKVFSNLEDLVMECGYAAGWIQSLKAKGYKVYVLSNYGRTLFGYARQNFRFLHYIDGGVISYEVQYIKPEIQIYERLIQKYGIRPQEAVFLDDTEENLPPARKLGMRTIHVTSHQAAVEGLKKLGIES